MCVVGVATALLMSEDRRVVTEAEAELRCGPRPGSVGGEAPCSGLH